MAKYRNTSRDTVRDALTGQVIGPDEVITVPDDLDPFFEDHPVWEPAAIVSASQPPAASTTPPVTAPTAAPAQEG